MAKEKLPYYVQELKNIDNEPVEATETLTAVPRVMLAGIDSEEYIIKIAMGLLNIWNKQGISTVPFAIGPDYSNLESLRSAGGQKAYSLDSFFQGTDELAYLLTHYSEAHDLALLVAGQNYYDTHLPYNSAWSSEMEVPEGSPADLSLKTNTPVIMVLNFAKLSFTNLAEIAGILSFRNDQQIAGFILVGMDPDQEDMTRTMIENEFEMPVFATFGENIGEVPSPYSSLPEVARESWQKNLDSICQNLYARLDMNKILRLARRATDLGEKFPDSLFKAQKMVGFTERKFNLAVARDEAFNDFFQENIDILAEMGANIIYFSPIEDPILPAKVDGIYLGSGDLLKHLAEVSKNKSMRQQIRDLAGAGLPILAEGTGAVYLADSYHTNTGMNWPLVGVLPSVVSSRANKTENYYAKLTARRDDLLCRHNQDMRCLMSAEFIFEPNGASYRYLVRGLGHQMEVFSTATVWASQFRLNFYAAPTSVARFALKCLGEEALK